MKSQFEVFYEKSNIDFNSLDESTLIVLDANVMLNFFRYSEKGRQQLFKALKTLQANLFIPYQAALEYHFSRQSVDRANAKNIDKLETKINSAKTEFISTVSGALKEYGETIRSTDEEAVRNMVLKEFEESFSNFFDEFKRNSLVKETELIKKDSNISIKIAEILEGRVGKKFNKEEIDGIEKEGEVRYKEDIPPGYKDKEKGNLVRVFGEYKYKQKFGDLILWKEIIRYCEEHKEIKRVFFVSDDVKQDWLFETKGETVGIRVELKQELFEACGATIEIFRTSKFLNEVFIKEEGTVKIKEEPEINSKIDTSSKFLNLTFNEKLKLEKSKLNDYQDVYSNIGIEYFKHTELLLGNLKNINFENIKDEMKEEIFAIIFDQFEKDMNSFYDRYSLILQSNEKRMRKFSSIDTLYTEYIYCRYEENDLEGSLDLVYDILARIKRLF